MFVLSTSVESRINLSESASESTLATRVAAPDSEIELILIRISALFYTLCRCVSVVPASHAGVGPTLKKT